MKLFLTTFLLCACLLCKQQGCAQENIMNVIQIEFEERKYDSLSLSIRLGQHREIKRINGHSEDGYLWVFSYPDNLYDSINLFTVANRGTVDTSRRSVMLSHVLHGDTMVSNGLFFERQPVSHIKARYVNTRISGTFISDIFDISTDDMQLVAALKAMHSGFMLLNQPLTYEEILQNDMEVVRQYPDSRRLIALVANNMGRFNSKTDIANVFHLFSSEIQESHFGQIVYRHLHPIPTVFENRNLNVWDKDVEEAIVQDFSKYNLIIFSASWCQPCIRQIPALKEIYQDFGENLIMTYVSMDDERSADAWRAKMRTHQIPWRSLMVLTKEKGEAISDDYGFLGAVPYFILVHPDNMQMEPLGSNVEVVRQRLDELIKEL